MGRLNRLDAADPTTRIAALRELTSFEDYGIVDSGIAALVLSSRALRPLDEDEAEATRNALDGVRTIHAERKRALEQAERSDFWARISPRCSAPRGAGGRSLPRRCDRAAPGETGGISIWPRCFTRSSSGSASRAAMRS